MATSSPTPNPSPTVSPESKSFYPTSARPSANFNPYPEESEDESFSWFFDMDNFVEFAIFSAIALCCALFYVYRKKKRDANARLNGNDDPSDIPQSGTATDTGIASAPTTAARISTTTTIATSPTTSTVAAPISSPTPTSTPTATAVSERTGDYNISSYPIASSAAYSSDERPSYPSSYATSYPSSYATSSTETPSSYPTSYATSNDV